MKAPFCFDSDEFPAPEMNNQDRINAGHWEWELGSNPGTRFCLVSSNVFIGSIRYDLNRLYHIRIGLAAGVSDVNLLKWKTHIRSSETTDKWLAEETERKRRRQIHRQEYFRNKLPPPVKDIFDQLIRNSWNLIWQKVPELELPVSI